jgi:succinate dehydrogenase/fumarate reductase flavoprotein subunit
MYVYVRGTTAAGDGHLMAAVDNPAPKDSHPVPWNHTAANRVGKLLRDQTTVDFDAEEAWQTIWTLRDWYRLALVLQTGRLFDRVAETVLVARLIGWSEQKCVSLRVTRGLIEGEHELPVKSERMIKRDIPT